MTLMSENINELMSALAKAQGKIQPASKDKANPFFKSKYADLASVWEACRDSLSENGLAVVQTIQQKSEGMTLLTILGHASGQWIRSEMPIIVSKNDPQTLGSAITYYRRYSLSAIVGVAPNDDDDGERAQAGYRKTETAKPRSEPTAIPLRQLISKQQTDDLSMILKNCDVKYKEWFLSAIKKPPFNANSLSEIPLANYQEMKTSVLKHIDEQLAKQKQPEEAYVEHVQ